MILNLEYLVKLKFSESLEYLIVLISSTVLERNPLAVESQIHFRKNLEACFLFTQWDEKVRDNCRSCCFKCQNIFSGYDLPRETLLYWLF